MKEPCVGKHQEENSYGVPARGKRFSLWGHSAALSVRPKHSASKPHFSPVTSVMPAGLSHSALPKSFLLSPSEKALYENHPSSETAVEAPPLWRHPSAVWWCCSCSHPRASHREGYQIVLNVTFPIFSVWKYFPLRSVIPPGKTPFIQILSGLQVSLQGLMH